jgi:flagellar biogenesis protein FliO
MDIAFAFKVVWAFALVALLLYVMLFVARAMQRGRVVAATGTRLVSTIESTLLAQHVSVHVVRVADKYFLVGGGTAGVSLLAELPKSEIEPYVELQRATLAAQRETLMRPFTRFFNKT